MLFAQVTVMERHEHDALRHDVADLRRRDHEPAPGDDSHPVAVEDTDAAGVGDVQRDEDLRRRVIELWRLARLRPSVPLVNLASADGEDGELVIGALERRGFPPEVVDALHKSFRLLTRSGLNTSQAVERIRADVPASAEIETLLEFIRASERGFVK